MLAATYRCAVLTIRKVGTAGVRGSMRQTRMAGESHSRPHIEGMGQTLRLLKNLAIRSSTVMGTFTEVAAFGGNSN